MFSFLWKKKDDTGGDSALVMEAKNGYGKDVKVHLNKHTDKEDTLNPEWLRQWKITSKLPFKFH